MDSRPRPSREFLALQAAVAGRYSLEREIGRGGMGIVFLARDVTLDRPVAIKLLPPTMATQRELRDRFLGEARTAAKLSHPHIIPIHSVEAVTDFVFFVMAYVEGETLGHRIRSRGPLPPAEGLRILKEIAWALAYAHAQGVVHRDVKPDNILLEAGSGRALVADFGIAQLATADAGGGTSEVLGTPRFMSPEQASGEPVDARSDIYSLGVVAFYVLSGKPPFEADSPSEVLAHHIRTPIPRLTSAAPGVPGRLAAVVEQCLAKEPENRPSSGEAIAETLGAAEETRKELPVAVRVFVQESRAREGRWALYVVLTIWLVTPVIGALFAVGRPWGPVLGLGVAGLLVGTPLLLTTLRARRLVSAGYAQADLVHALDVELERRREELVFVYGPDHAAVAGRLRKLSTGALGLAAACLAGAFLNPIWIGGALMLGTAAGIAGSLAAKRSDYKARRRVRFWRGKVGRWLLRLAGIGLGNRLRRPEGLTHRPTEIAVGMAVEALFDALAKETRAALIDLPDVVHGLEADAQRMRGKVEELNALLANSGEARAGEGASESDAFRASRRQAVAQLEHARDGAQRRLAEAVAALENLRIDLLRMHAGTTNMDSVTLNLGTARELAAHIDRLLDGHQEIEETLPGS
jgi:serine/threonine-protein kinase